MPLVSQKILDVDFFRKINLYYLSENINNKIKKGGSI